MCTPGAGVVTHQLRLKCVPRAHVGEVHNTSAAGDPAPFSGFRGYPTHTCARINIYYMNKDTLFKMYLYGGAYDLCRLGPLMVPSSTDGTRSFLYVQLLIRNHLLTLDFVFTFFPALRNYPF